MLEQSSLLLATEPLRLLPHPQRRRPLQNPLPLLLWKQPPHPHPHPHPQRPLRHPLLRLLPHLFPRRLPPLRRLQLPLVRCCRRSFAV